MDNLYKIVGFEPTEGLEGEALDKALQEHVQKNFISREAAKTDPEIGKHHTGKVYGPLNTKLKQGFGLSEADIKGDDGSILPYEDILAKGLAKKEEENKALKEAAAGNKDVEKHLKRIEELETANKSWEEKHLELGQKLENAEQTALNR